ncbi:hypothetical protein O4H66_28295 [Comamonadaceae bacterium G21597-S1]|nr:hypothetical protein [Comamonadaceae bacterium G21597-S1]
MMRPMGRPRARRSGLHPLVSGVMCLWLAACVSPPPAPTSTAPIPAGVAVEVQRMPAGPTVYALLPPEARDASVEGAAEARAHAGFALADTQRCLGSMPHRIETVFADRLVVVDGPRRQAFAPDPMGAGIGAVLVEPGRDGVMVQPMVGASALSYQLQQAAFDYWRAPACRQQR